MKKNTMKKVLTIISVFFALWLAMGITDYIRVSHFERPFFALLDAEECYEDGGSGPYRGLGYSFDILGNFMPEEEYPGVRQYTYRLFGVELTSGVRD